MSIQPSPISDHDANLSSWQLAGKLADLLADQFNFDSLITCILDILERHYSIKAIISLAPQYSHLINDVELQNRVSAYIESPIETQLAFQENTVLPDVQDMKVSDDSTKIIVLPLGARKESMGVIKLDKFAERDYSKADYAAITFLTSLFSISLYYLEHQTQIDYLNNFLRHLVLIEEINKSILSNLERDSLLNNILSLLKQKFSFSHVFLFTTTGEASNKFKVTEISEEGIEPEIDCSIENERATINWTSSNRIPLCINNTDIALIYSVDDFPQNCMSELVLPLLYGEDLIGVLDLCADSLDAFGPETLKGFQYLAQSIAIAIRNANLYHFEQLNRMIVEHLQKNIGTISVEAKIDDVLDCLLDELEDIMSWDAAGIWMVWNSTMDSSEDQFESTIQLVAARTSDKSLTDSGQSFSSITGELLAKYIGNPDGSQELLSAYPWVTDIYNSETPVVRNSTDAYEPLGALLGFKTDYSAISIPIKSNGQNNGIIIAMHRNPEHYQEESRSIASLFGIYASVALENAKLYNAVHDQAWISTVLLQMAEAIQPITNLEDLLETLVGMLPGLLGVNACMVFLWDPSLELFYPQKYYGFEADQLSRFNDWEIYTGALPAFDRMRQTRNPVILDIDSVPEEIRINIFPTYNLRADLVILFPVFTQNGLYGAILVDFSGSELEVNAGQEVWDEKYSITQGAAHQTAITIENIQLLKLQEEEAYISVALLQVAQAIVSLNNLDEILKSIVRITPILVGVKRCLIYLWDGKDMVLRQSESYGFTKNDLVSLGVIIKANGFPFIEAVQQNNQIIYHSAGQKDASIDWNKISPEDYKVVERIITDSGEDISIKLDDGSLMSRDRLVIGFPLSLQGEILGVLLIEEEEPGKGSPSGHIREKRIEIVKGITQQAAVAIKNELLQQAAVKSERLEREYQLAREIQTTFLPDNLPVIPGWDVGVRWRPARQVGGDFYDILTLDGDRIGFVMADVADKGMPAALFMTLIRTLIRSAAKEKISPAAVLKQVNDLLVPDAKHGTFVTVFYGVLSQSSGKLIFANAGHNPPILNHTDQEKMVELTRTSMALGIFEDIDIQEQQVSLNPGDWLLLYTDGITEAFSVNEEMFGSERLMKILAKHKFSSSENLINLIEQAVEDFIVGVELSDDMTMTVISRDVL